jgi:DNA (cytosine-5)-methyltransferase 1
MREETPFWANTVPAKTIANEKEQLVGTRKLTIREMARLQTFPDWYNFTGTEYSMSKQIGNAVPPLFARQLFSAIFEQL